MSDHTKDLLLCALRRMGRPATAGEVVDAAIGLAQAENWPRSSYQKLEPRACAKHLQAHPDVARLKMAERGDGRPLWMPADSRYDASAPLPAAPAPPRGQHPLDGLTTTQMFLVFDVLSDALDTLTRHDKERAEVHQRHLGELCTLAQKCKATLIAAGLKE